MKNVRGLQIAYIPNHANGDFDHTDVEYGFVTSCQPDGKYFCRYWVKGKPGVLRTKSCSELTPSENLFFMDSVDQSVVDAALAEIEAGK